MLRQNGFNRLIFEGANRGLFRPRTDVGIMLKHLITDVPGRGANGLLGNVRVLRKARNKGMPQVMPEVGHSCLLQASSQPLRQEPIGRLRSTSYIVTVRESPPMPTW